MNFIYLTLHDISDDIKCASYFLKINTEGETDGVKEVASLLKNSDNKKVFIFLNRVYGIAHMQPMPDDRCDSEYHVHFNSAQKEVTVLKAGKVRNQGTRFFKGSVAQFIEKFEVKEFSHV